MIADGPVVLGEKACGKLTDVAQGRVDAGLAVGEDSGPLSVADLPLPYIDAGNQCVMLWRNNIQPFHAPGVVIGPGRGLQDRSAREIVDADPTLDVLVIEIQF